VLDKKFFVTFVATVVVAFMAYGARSSGA